MIHLQNSLNKMKFNPKEHIDYRKKRLQQTNINNKKLLGLTAVEINPTELCNRTCSFCPRHDPLIYPNRNLNMSVDTAKLLCAQLLEADYTGDINITGFGEPLLNKDIVEICNLFSKHFHTEIITNGDNLINNKFLVTDFSSLALVIVDCYDGKSQIDKVTSLFNDTPVNYLIRNHYDAPEVDAQESYGFNNRGGSLYKAETMHKPCYLPAYKAFVDWNGDVRLCCNDWFRLQDSFGNITEREFSNIWMSDAFATVRKELAIGNRNKYKPCQSCDVAGTLVGEESVALWTQ